MPSKNAASKQDIKPEVKKEELIEVKAVRAFFVDYTKKERADLSSEDRKGRSFVGATKRINPDEVCELSRDMAVKLQDAGVVRIVI